MYRWIISYENEETLGEILKTGIVIFEPKLDVKFIIMDSYLNKDTIMKIKGVIECREPGIGTLC